MVRTCLFSHEHLARRISAKGLGEVLCTVETRTQAPSPSPRSREALERKKQLRSSGEETRDAGYADACMLMCRVCLEETNDITAKELKFFITTLGDVVTMRSPKRHLMSPSGDGTSIVVGLNLA